jgi:hypothetical protein
VFQRLGNEVQRMPPTLTLAAPSKPLLTSGRRPCLMEEAGADPNAGVVGIGGGVVRQYFCRSDLRLVPRRIATSSRSKDAVPQSREYNFSPSVQ